MDSNASLSCRAQMSMNSWTTRTECCCVGAGRTGGLECSWVRELPARWLVDVRRVEGVDRRLLVLTLEEVVLDLLVMLDVVCFILLLSVGVLPRWSNSVRNFLIFGC